GGAARRAAGRDPAPAPGRGDRPHRLRHREGDPVSRVRPDARPPAAPGPTPQVEALKPYSVPAAGRRNVLRLDFNESTVGPSPRVLERLSRLEVEDISL